MKRDEIFSLRKRIDRLDRRLSLLLLRRFRLVGRVGKLKRDKGYPILDGGREEDVLKKISARSSDPYTSDLLRQIYAGIFKVSYEIEKGG